MRIRILLIFLLDVLPRANACKQTRLSVKWISLHPDNFRWRVNHFKVVWIARISKVLIWSLVPLQDQPANSFQRHREAGTLERSWANLTNCSLGVCNRMSSPLTDVKPINLRAKSWPLLSVSLDEAMSGGRSNTEASWLPAPGVRALTKPFTDQAGIKPSNCPKWLSKNPTTPTCQELPKRWCLLSRHSCDFCLLFTMQALVYPTGNPIKASFSSTEGRRQLPFLSHKPRSSRYWQGGYLYSSWTQRALSCGEQPWSCWPSTWLLPRSWSSKSRQSIRGAFPPRQQEMTCLSQHVKEGPAPSLSKNTLGDDTTWDHSSHISKANRWKLRSLPFGLHHPLRQRSPPESEPEPKGRPHGINLWFEAPPETNNFYDLGEPHVASCLNQTHPDKVGLPQV